MLMVLLGISAGNQNNLIQLPLFVETFLLQPRLGVFAAFAAPPAQEESAGSAGYWDVGSETPALGEKGDIFAGLLRRSGHSALKPSSLHSDLCCGREVCVMVKRNQQQG